MADEDLVLLARAGDVDAFVHLARTRGDRQFGLARRILRDFDLAEDAVQQALVIAWRELPRLRDPGRFDAWLTRIVVRCCYEAARASRRHAAVQLQPDARARESWTVDPALAVVDRDQLEQAFRRLPPDHRAVLVLHHYIGLEPAEIAETLGIPAGTARSRLHYAHRAMRAALEADERVVVAGGRPA